MENINLVANPKLSEPAKKKTKSSSIYKSPFINLYDTHIHNAVFQELLSISTTMEKITHTGEFIHKIILSFKSHPNICLNFNRDELMNMNDKRIRQNAAKKKVEYTVDDRSDDVIIKSTVSKIIEHVRNQYKTLDKEAKNLEVNNSSESDEEI